MKRCLPVVFVFIPLLLLINTTNLMAAIERDGKYHYAFLTDIPYMYHSMTEEPIDYETFFKAVGRREWSRFYSLYREYLSTNNKIKRKVLLDTAVKRIDELRQDISDHSLVIEGLITIEPYDKQSKLFKVAPFMPRFRFLNAGPYRFKLDHAVIPYDLAIESEKKIKAIESAVFQHTYKRVMHASYTVKAKKAYSDSRRNEKVITFELESIEAYKPVIAKLNYSKPRELLFKIDFK